MPSRSTVPMARVTGMEPSITHISKTDQLHEDDTSTLGSNESEETSPDLPKIEGKICPWHDFYVDSHHASTVLEGWEMISVRPTMQCTSAKRVLGVDAVSTYAASKDGYTGVRAIPSYTQAELAAMVAGAEAEWTARQSGLARRFLSLRGKRGTTYGQDLARRLFELPACLPSKLGALLDCRFVATNKNPHVRREWKVVMLQPITEVITDEGVPAQNKHNHGYHADVNSNKHNHNGNGNGGRQSQPIQKWLVIIRGQETRFSKQGFANFGTMSNPWHKVDEGLRGA